MEDFEILETSKSTIPNHSRITDVWGNRILVKSKIPEWKKFPAHFNSTAFVDDYERVKHFQVYEDDVWLIGYPRSGTTLTQELLWILVNDFDFDGALATDTYNRAVLFDYWNGLHHSFNLPIDYMNKMARPRVFKCHSAVQFLPNQIWTVKPRIIHISRDVKDVAISFYHLRKDLWNDGVGTIEEHFEEILNDEALWCPYREHVMNYQNLPNYANICYLTYEKVVTDLKATIRKLADFLNIEVSDDNVQKLKDHLSFDNMSKNKMTNLQDLIDKWKNENNYNGAKNTYIRKGIIGDHKNGMTEATIKRFDEWMDEGKYLKSPWDNR